MAEGVGSPNSTSGRVNLKDKSEETDASDIPYIYIEEEKDVQSAIDDIKVAGPLIAVDCEGIKLSRKGKLTILSIAIRKKVYVFDVLKLNSCLIFDNGLRSILENKNIEKLMFDCREDADILQHSHQVKIDGVLDIQLLEIMKRDQETRNYRIKRSERHNEVIQLKGLLRCLKEYKIHENIISKKEKGGEIMHLDKNVWGKRPLSKDLLSYVSVDVASLHLLFDHFGPDEEEMNRLRFASERYANLQRSKQSRNYDEYEKNKYLPIDILPEKGSTYIKTGNTQCTTCKRFFPQEEFSRTQLSCGEQKCRTCKRVKRDADVQANREDNWERQYQLEMDNWCEDDENFLFDYDNILY